MKQIFIKLAALSAAILVCLAGCAEEASDTEPTAGETAAAQESSAALTTAAQTTAELTTAAVSTAATQASTAKKSAEPATTAVPATQGATLKTYDIPPNDVTASSINPNIALIMNRVAQEIASYSVRGFSLSLSKLNLEVGETAEIDISYTPSDAYDKRCFISLSSDCAEARYSNSKITVTALKPGECEMTVTTVTNLSLKCAVTVIGGEAAPTGVTEETTVGEEPAEETTEYYEEPSADWDDEPVSEEETE